MLDDLGVSNERTALAWQRTALALIAGTAILARLTYGVLGWFALVALTVALLLSAWIFFESRARYSHHADVRRRAAPRRGGRAPASIAVATALIAGTELAALLVAR